jgi:hypothetical protein
LSQQSPRRRTRRASSTKQPGAWSNRTILASSRRPCWRHFPGTDGINGYPAVGKVVGRGAIGVTAGSDEIIGLGPCARRTDGFVLALGFAVACDTRAIILRTDFFVARRLILGLFVRVCADFVLDLTTFFLVLRFVAFRFVVLRFLAIFALLPSPPS